jgi:hypothetical protein
MQNKPKNTPQFYMYDRMYGARINKIYLYLGGKGQYVTFATLYRRAV